MIIIIALQEVINVMKEVRIFIIKETIIKREIVIFTRIMAYIILFRILTIIIIT